MKEKSTKVTDLCADQGAKKDKIFFEKKVPLTPFQFECNSKAF